MRGNINFINDRDTINGSTVLKLISSFCNSYNWLFLFLVLVTFLTTSCKDSKSHTRSVFITDTATWPKSFGFGHAATATEIATFDIDVMPDGHGLPAGAGDVTTGKRVYEIKCAACHGKTGTEGPFNKLVGVIGNTNKAKTIGNYWPYSTTLFDYIRRAMPYNMPGSLNDNEVYSLTAFLLYKNQIIDSVTAMNADNLPKVKMPAQKLFVNDDRHGGPEVR